ncbi:MAG: hemolysin family protein [Vicinamibacterales bacterium]
MIDLGVTAGIILLLLLANALFVAAEFAIVGASRTSIEHQAAQGSRLARGVMRILDDPTLQDRYIATTQIGISVASLGLGMYGEHVLADWIAVRLNPLGLPAWIAVHAVASTIAVAILTFLHIVIGEMIPKALALQQAATTVLYVSPPIQLLERVLFPLVVALNGIGNGLLRLAGMKRQQVETERYHTTEELQFIIKESQEGGQLRGEGGHILRDLFAFGDLTAGEILVPRVQLHAISVGAEADELRAIVRSHPHTRYPVYEGDLDNIIGSLHIKDVLRHIVTGRPVSSRDARPLPYVPGPAYLDTVLGSMRRSQTQMAVVMDQHGGTAGIVTMGDLFQEVVGEIDEGRDTRPIVRDEQGRVHVRGTVRLRDAGEALGYPIEKERVTSISGLVLTLLERPAVVGDVVMLGPVRIEVTVVSGRGVAEAMLQLTKG